MSVEKRQLFLSSNWRPYPAVEEGWTVVSDLNLELIGAGPAVTCLGRLTHPQGVPHLQWNSVSWQLPEEFLTHRLVGTSFEARDVVLEGDILAVRVERGRVSQVEMLVPCRSNDPFSSRQVLGQTWEVPELTKLWASFLQQVRNYFVNRGFVETRTPSLVPSPGLEPHLDPLSLDVHVGRQRFEMYLPTSPEFHLKKLLVMGCDRLFELKDCFRDGELTEHHQIEFLMLEWYRAFSNLDLIEEDLRGLVSHVESWACQFVSPRSEGVAREVVPEVVTVADLFKQFYGFELTPKTTARELVELAKRSEIFADPNEDFDDVFFRLMIQRIEPTLGKLKPQVVRNWPPSQAALARLTKEGWADRFEFYWRGLEIANAFHELNDPLEQRRRFSRDIEKKISLGKAPVPVDRSFLEALDYGLPPASGIALGVDRLFMAVMGISEISGARVFPMNMRCDA